MTTEKPAFGSNFIYERLLSFPAEKGTSDRTFTTSQEANFFGISVYQARYYLGILHESGMIRRNDLRRGRKTEWTIR